MVVRKKKTDESMEKLRRKTHLPRDWQGLIRLPWLENFYETLYASNECGIFIPYTVVFQYRRIYAAYYTDSDGYVQKIDKIADLGPEQVLEGLQDPSLQPKGTVGCRAVYTYVQKSDIEGFRNTDTQDLSVEFFDDPSTTHFLTYRSKENNGILQQFMEPATPGVCSVKAYWTPHYCNLEGRMNVHRADQQGVAMGQRLVTHEGELHHSAPFPMSSRVKIRVNRVIERIVQFIKDCLPPNVRIQLMILQLKMGADGKVWFLYCNSLKLFDISIDAGSFGRDSESLRPSSSHLVEASIPPPGVRGSKKRKGLVCPSTDTRLGPFDKYRVPVWQVLVHFLWHGPRLAWAHLGRVPPSIQLEGGTDPGLRDDTLRFLVTMDLRSPPIGRPFAWNAGISPADVKIRDVHRWSLGCQEAHRSLEKQIEMSFLENPEQRLAYKFFEATVVWLLSQELEHLSQENFRQERVRPLFLNSTLHCGEEALFVYATTLDTVLEEDRKRLIKPVYEDTALHHQLMTQIADEPPMHGEGGNRTGRGVESSPRKGKGDGASAGERGGGGRDQLSSREESGRYTTRGSNGGMTQRGSWRGGGTLPPMMVMGQDGAHHNVLRSGVTSLAGSSLAKRMMAQIIRTQTAGMHGTQVPPSPRATLMPIKSPRGSKVNRMNSRGRGPSLPTVIVTDDILSQMCHLLTPRDELYR